MRIYPHPSKHKRYAGETWWLLDFGSGKNRKKRTFKGTYEEAEAYGEAIEPDDTNYKERKYNPIRDLLIPFLQFYKNEVSPRTIKDFRFSIDLYFVPYFGNLRPGQLTLDKFAEFKESLLEKGLSPTTINKHLNYLSSLLKWAAENEYCKPLAFKIPRFPKKKIVSKPIHPISSRQLDALYKQILPQYKLSFLFMSDMGLRQEEAMSVKIEDVDEHYKVVTVKGKGSKYRQVPYMSDRFERELDKVLADRLDGYLVINPQTGTKYVNIWKEIKRAAAAAGLTRKVNHHILRHTFATLTAEKGINPHALQKILGHASIETTNKIYTKVSLDFVGNEARKIRALDR